MPEQDDKPKPTDRPARVERVNKAILTALREALDNPKRKPGMDHMPTCIYVDTEGNEHKANVLGYVKGSGFQVYVRDIAAHCYAVGSEPGDGVPGVKASK